MIKNKINSKLINAAASLKLVSLLMLVSIFVCCFISIFNNNQVFKFENSAVKSNGNSNQLLVSSANLFAGNLNSTELAEEFSFVISKRLSKKTKCSNLDYGCSLLGVNTFNDQLSLIFYSVLQRQGQNSVHTLIENIGISERFQV